MLDLINWFFYCVRTCCDLGHTSTHTKRYHDAVFHHIGLLNGTNDVSCDYLSSFCYTWFEGPFGVTIEIGNLHPTNQKIAGGDFLETFQGALDPVKHLRDQAWSQFNRKGGSGCYHWFSWTNSRRFFVYLDRGFVTPHLNNFANQTKIADPANVLDIGLLHP